MHKIKRPPLWKFLTEIWRSLPHFALSHGFYDRIVKTAPKGDGHPVMLFPGFFATNNSLYMIRNLCKDLGYDPHHWREEIRGWNLGPNPRIFPDKIRDALDMAEAELIRHHRRTGQKITIIGQSLGGVYASLLARKHPDKIRSVITLGSPIQAHKHPKSVSKAAEIFFELLNPENDLTGNAEIEALMDLPSPVPTTHIYSLGDGVVHWKTSISDPSHDSATTENIEITGAHLAQGISAQSLIIIADRLAQPETGWQPFDRKRYPYAFSAKPMAHERLRRDPAITPAG